MASRTARAISGAIAQRVARDAEQIAEAEAARAPLGRGEARVGVGDHVEEAGVAEAELGRATEQRDQRVGVDASLFRFLDEFVFKVFIGRPEGHVHKGSAVLVRCAAIEG